MTAPPIAVAALGWFKDNLRPEQQHWLAFIPSLYWYWHWYALALMFASIVVLLVSAPAANRELLKDLRRKHIRSFRDFRERNEKPPIVIIQGTPDPPNIVCAPKGRAVYRNERGVLFERDAGEEKDSDLYAVTADFKNAMHFRKQIGEARDVTARIFLRPFNIHEEQAEVDRGAWLRNQDGRVTLPINQTRELVIATLENGRVFAVRQLADADSGEKITTRLAVPNLPLSVHVTLTEELGKKMVRRAQFMLERDPNEALQLTLMSTWLWHQLQDLRDRGDALWQRAIGLSPAERPAKEPIIEIEFQQWRDVVEKFLLERWDTDHAAKFSPPPPESSKPKWFNALLPPEPKELHGRINAKLKIVTTFIEEVSMQTIKEYG